MTSTELQSLCEQGQQQLMLMRYLDAEQTLIKAEQIALSLRDFDTLSRLYMPLQEARRQRRQRCGEGICHLRLLATGPDDPQLNASLLVDRYPQGQLLIAGWGGIDPARTFRRLQAERSLFVETYLAAVYPPIAPGGPRLVAIVPLEDAQMPSPIPRPIDQLISLLPAQSIVLAETDLPEPRNGDFETYASTMALWERLHAPFLAAADNQGDPIQKMDSYRRTIAVDYACELAHQKLSTAARGQARMMLAGG